MTVRASVFWGARKEEELAAHIPTVEGYTMALYLLAASSKVYAIL